MVSLSRVTAVLTTFVALGFLTTGLMGFSMLANVLFLLMLLGVMGLLVSLLLLPGNNKLWSKRQLMHLRTHVCLHLVPFSYLALQLETSPSLSANAWYYFPLAVFFYTGRRAWQAFFKVFGSKIYKLFYLGNTGMMVSLGILLGLGYLSKEATIMASFHRLFMLYFGVHLLIVGAIVIKIENDIVGARAVL